jgi:hypothetical protein
MKEQKNTYLVEHISLAVPNHKWFVEHVPDVRDAAEKHTGLEQGVEQVAQSGEGAYVRIVS